MLLKNNKEFNKNIIIKKEDEIKKLFIICDPAQIKQVFFNLLINAVEAVSSDGKIEIKGRVNQVINATEVMVIDNGIGMDKERIASLFEPFSSGKEKGIGLGLAIAYSIIKEHGGSIEVESKAGEGSVFKIILPCAEVEK